MFELTRIPFVLVIHPKTSFGSNTKKIVRFFVGRKSLRVAFFPSLWIRREFTRNINWSVTPSTNIFLRTLIEMSIKKWYMFKDEREKFAFLSLKLSRVCVCECGWFASRTYSKNKLDLNFLRRTNIQTDTFSTAAVNVMVRLPSQKHSSHYYLFCRSYHRHRHHHLNIANHEPSNHGSYLFLWLPHFIGI